MKLKKRYIIILLLVIFISITGFILKNKNIEISNIFNKNDKLASYSFQEKGECNQWINISSISSSDIVFKASNYIVIEAKNTNLATIDGNTGYEGYAFINNDGCAVKISDVTTITNDNTSACLAMKEHILAKENISYWADIYNNFVKDNYCTNRIVVETKVESDARTACLNAGGDYVEPNTAAKIAVLDQTKSGKRYQIINAYSTTIEGSGYEGFAFLVNGCTSPINDTIYGQGFASLFNDNAQLCSSIKHYITNVRSQENIYNWNYWAGIYNDLTESGSVCAGQEKLTLKVEHHECSYDFDEEYGWPNWRYDGYVDYGWSGAHHTEEEWYEYWLSETADNCGCNSNLKYFVGTTTAKNVLSAKCGSDYVLNESGLHSHTATDSKGNTQTSCYKDGVFYQKGACKFECTEAARQEIINNNDVSSAQQFNSTCSELSEIPMSTIIMNWNGGWGPNTLGENWGGENGVYTITGIVGNKHKVEFDNNLIYYNYDLEGWSKNQTCTSYDSSIENPASKNPVFTFDSTNVTYYACYEGGMFEETLFNDDATKTKKTGTTYKVYEDNICTDDEVITNNLTTVPMKSTNRYVKESYDTIKTESVLGQDNIYCNVLCVDTIDVYYPNIFETIPAGQYFELMYEPEIKATRTCQSEFRYNDWKTAYQNAIKEEKEAMDEYEEAKADYNSFDALVISSDGTCDCDTCGESPYTYPCNCSTYYSSSTTEYKYYYKTTSETEYEEHNSWGKCDDDGSTTLAAKEDAMEAALVKYKTKVTERIKLEQFNLQCYTILDQDSGTGSGTSIKNEAVFKNNYTYKDKYKGEILNVNDLTYELNTPYVTPPTLNTSTKSNYASYVTTNAGYTTSGTNPTLYATSIKNVGSTANFFSIYPSLTLKYDDGSEGKPTSLNQVQTLDVEAHVKQDTGSYTHINEDGTYEKNSSTDTISTSYTEFHYNGSTKKKYIDFSPYTATKTKRTVNYYFTYHEAQEYISEIQSGIVKQKSGDLNNYIDLYNKQIVTLNESAVQKNIYNNVLPVSLKAINSKNYEIKLELSDKDRTIFLNGSTEYNTYLQLTANDTFDDEGFTGNYTCQYEITNDALTLSDKVSEDFKKLKSNTIFRSVATENIDPNNRGNYGNLGENWTNDKGKAVQESMKKIETNNGTATNDTYNPKNLEYSFTLTPAIIKAIKSTSVPAGYNAGNNYDDFNLTCAKDDGRDLGRECTSEFLTELSEGKVDGVEVQPNYSNINSWGLTDLTNIRKKWKYYNGITGKIEIKTATVDMNGNIATPAMGLEEYLSNYEKWGVRP